MDRKDKPTSKPKPFKTMHDHVELWEDTCCCEPEPRWAKVGEEMEEAQRKEKAKRSDKTEQKKD